MPKVSRIAKMKPFRQWVVVWSATGECVSPCYSDRKSAVDLKNNWFKRKGYRVVPVLITEVRKKKRV